MEQICLTRFSYYQGLIYMVPVSKGHLALCIKKVRQNGFQWLCVHDKQNPYLNVLLAQERSNQPLRVLQFSGAIEEAAGALSSQQCPERSLVFNSLAARIPLLVYTFTSNHTELCAVKSELNNDHYSLNYRSIEAHI